MLSIDFFKKTMLPVTNFFACGVATNSRTTVVTFLDKFRYFGSV